MATDTPGTAEKNAYPVFERILAYITVAIIAIAVAAYLTTLIVAMVAGPAILAEGMWEIVVFISYIGLPLGFALLIVLLVMNFSRRSRAR